MDKILTALKETLMLIMGRPETVIETVLVAVIPLLVGVLVLGKLGRAMDAKEESIVRSMIVMATGVVVVVLGLTLSDLFVVPAVSQDIGKWISPAVAAVLTLAVTVPVCLFMLKQTYVSAAITTILAAGIVAVLIYLTGFSHDQIVGARRTGGDIGKRTRGVEQVLEGD